VPPLATISSAGGTAARGGRLRPQRAGHSDFAQVFDPAALLRAFQRARRAKRGSGGEPAFYFDLERNITTLSEQLQSRTWRPDPYRHFIVRHTKERRVAEASFRDRVVHHSLIAALEPVWEPQLSPHTYACRRGKGQHAALDAAQAMIRGHRFALTLDILHYFDHVDHAILLDVLAAGSADEGTLWLCGAILQAANAACVGIPIGNLTSQFWANIYLHEIDRLAEREVGIGNYQRYMDDMLLVADDKAVLWRAAERLTKAMRDLRRLAPKPLSIRVVPSGDGVLWLGMRLFPSVRRLAHEGKRRLFAKMAASQAHARRHALADEGEVARARSLCGHLQGYDFVALRRAVCQNARQDDGDQRLQPGRSRR